MALGIACAGTGQREAIALLEPMVKFDPVNFVRQGALIASAMILIQQTDQTCPKVSFFRTLYAQVISNKHEDVIAKYGAILAQGIIDAGGRNVTLSLQSRTGHTNMLAVVGTLVFTQYWYWFPLAHCLALAFTPTCLIALNKQLKMPKIEFRSNSKPSLYAYPAPLEEKKREEREKVTTAVLSIAARARKRDSAQTNRISATSAIASTASTPNVASTPVTTPVQAVQAVQTTTASVLEKMEVDEEPLKEEKEKLEKKAAEEKKTVEKKLSTEDVSTKKEQEPTFEILNNPARCLRQQLKNVTLVDGSSYSPMKDVSIGGIIMMHHLRSDEEQLVEPVAAFGPKTDDEKEPEAPEPFEWKEDII